MNKKEYHILKTLTLNGEYLGDGNFETYRIAIYSIPLNKKGFCKTHSEVENRKGEIEHKPICKNYNNKAYCNECVNLAKQIYKMNKE